MGIFGNILGNIVGSLLPFSQGGMIKSNLYTNKRKQKTGMTVAIPKVLNLLLEIWP
jgi:hypothetical protein